MLFLLTMQHTLPCCLCSFDRLKNERKKSCVVLLHKSQAPLERLCRSTNDRGKFETLDAGLEGGFLLLWVFLFFYYPPTMDCPTLEGSDPKSFSHRLWINYWQLKKPVSLPTLKAKWRFYAMSMHEQLVNLTGPHPDVFTSNWVIEVH